MSITSSEQIFIEKDFEVNDPKVFKEVDKIRERLKISDDSFRDFLDDLLLTDIQFFDMSRLILMKRRFEALQGSSSASGPHQ